MLSSKSCLLTHFIRKEEDEDDYVYESIYSPDDPDLVRNHLNSGVLVKMLDKYEARLLSEENSDPFRAPGYIFMLLGACAIGLGCPIPKTYKTTMQKVYMCVDLPTGKFLPKVFARSH